MAQVLSLLVLTIHSIKMPPTSRHLLILSTVAISAGQCQLQALHKDMPRVGTHSGQMVLNRRLGALWGSLEAAGG